MSDMSINRGSLFWKLGFIFFIILSVLTFISVYVTSEGAQKHTLQVTQNLNRELALNTSEVVGPLLKESNYDAALADIMHSMMVINPSVEVYLLDASGKILKYVAPEKVVQLSSVNLAPVLEFIESPDKEMILGDDPRNTGKSTIFSAAKVGDDQYIYIVLASQQYVSAREMAFSGYITAIGIRTILIVAFFALVTGLIAIYFLSRPISSITKTFESFGQGNLTSRMSPLPGELKIVSCTFNDMAEQIQRSISSLESIDKLRKEIISNISHDLRTPIASVQGYIELLESKGDDLSKVERHEYFSIINKNINRLNKLVADLFEYSKLESGAITPQVEKASMAELVHDVAAKYRVLAGKKGLHLDIILPENLPLVNVDVGMIDRVLQNLVDNAVKFTPEGGVIAIRVSNEIEHQRLKVEVVDTGEGIDEKLLPHIFDRYFSNQGHSGQSGSGLGLSIARKILELHGSDILVKSKAGKGSTFTFNLPLAS